MTPREILELLLENPKRTAAEVLGLTLVITLILVGMSVFAEDHFWLDAMEAIR